MSDPAYPRDFFDEMLSENSPYAFYIFQWANYQSKEFDGARRYRLKMLHDIKLFDGTVYEQCYPNADSFHCKNKIVKDNEVEFIRISRKQHFHEWQHPQDLKD